MNIYDSFLDAEPAAAVTDETIRATEAINYITDLLSELQTIAAVSGQVDLSKDLAAVISKYRTTSEKAA